MPLSQNYPSLLQYIPCRLTEGEVWYLSYYALNPETGKLKRIRIKFNRIQNLTSRRKLAKQVINDINKKLSRGWNPFIEQLAEKGYKYIYDVLDTYLQVMAKESEAHSYRSYKSYIKWLKNWLSLNKYDETTYTVTINKEVAAKIMLDIKADSSKGLRTYNNYLQFFTALFNWMKQFNYVINNPFSDIKKIPSKKIKKNRRTLTPQERKSLEEYLLDNNHTNYLAMCYLCYYCCLRPNEISLLKVKDIDLQNQYVYVDETIAKNDNSSIRTIPDVAMPIFRQLNLNCPGNYYLFSFDESNKFVPGIKRAEGREIARFWTDVIRPNLNFPMELKFYSLKDTGITNLLAAGIAPNYVQGQADHSSLAITSIYAEKFNNEAHNQLRNIPNHF